jgi:transcriptional regulator with XRE-family HTH domain
MAAGDFGARLRELREKAGLTQEALARRVGEISTRQITRLEKGLHQPNWETVLALAAALGVDCLAFQAPAKRRPKPATSYQAKKASGRPGKGG